MKDGKQGSKTFAHEVLVGISVLTAVDFATLPSSTARENPALVREGSVQMLSPRSLPLAPAWRGTGQVLCVGWG